MRFNNAYDKTRDVAQTFDRKKITLVKAGKEFNVYDFIQANNIDTNIYEILEKYNCTADITPSQAGALINNSNKMNSLFGDFSKLQEIGDSRDIINYQNKANEMFLSLPLEIRSKFNNNALKFANEGEKWLREQLEAKQQTQQPVNIEKGEKNEQK